MTGRVLVYGFGNPGRQDDGLGPSVVEEIESRRFPGVSTDINYQLNIEDAEVISSFDTVIFVDASLSIDRPFLINPLEPSPGVTFSTHSLSPASVLALAKELYASVPRAYLLEIRGYSFDIEEGLTYRAGLNCAGAVDLLSRLLGQDVPGTGDMVKNDRTTSSCF